MNQDQKPNDSFEDRLLAELRAWVATREPEPQGVSGLSTGRRLPRLAIAGTGVAAVAATVLIVGAGGSDTPAAYAVTPQGNGSVSVEVRALRDPQGLERALDTAGVPAQVTYPTQDEKCDLSSPGSKGAAPEPVPVETVPAEAAPAPVTQAKAAAPVSGTEKEFVYRLTVDPSKVGDGRTLVLVAARAGDGEGGAVKATVAAGTVVCVPSAAPAETAPPTATVPAEPVAPAETTK